MTWFNDIGALISANESLLSGIAAIIVVGGVVLSVVMGGLRRMTGERAANRDASRTDPTDLSASETKPEAIKGSGNPERPITLKMLSAPSPHEKKFAHSDGLRIAYADFGSGPSTLLCAPGIISHLNLLSNLPGTRETFDELSEFARVLVFDKRGQGLSDPTLSTPDLDERTRDIGAVLDAAGVERAVLLGVSEGGPMTINFAHAHPERVQGLILLGTTATWVQSEDFPIGIPRYSMEGIVNRWGKGVLRDLFFPSVSREVLSDDTYRAFEHLIAPRSAIKQLIDMMIETDVRPLLPEIKVPTLVIHFSGDMAVPIRLGRFLADHVPNAEFLEVEGVDHSDLSQAPETFGRIRDFCERVSRAD